MAESEGVVECVGAGSSRSSGSTTTSTPESGAKAVGRAGPRGGGLAGARGLDELMDARVRDTRDGAGVANAGVVNALRRDERGSARGYD